MRASVRFRSTSREGGHFFNVITKLENLSGAASVTINLERHSDRKLFDILLARCDVRLYREKERPRGERGEQCQWVKEMTGRQIDHRNTFLIGSPGSPHELEGEKLIPRVRFRPEVSATQRNVTTWLRALTEETKSGTSVRLRAQLATDKPAMTCEP